MALETIDLIVVAAYAVALILIAFVVSREKAGHQKDTKDYFLAGKSLRWWAVGASLIAANISAEQIIGMSGSGYAIGLAIASYEWMAALTLIIVGKYLLPIFLAKQIYTMPQFLEQRYNSTVKSVMAVFWLGVYVFVNLTSILWLGAIAISSLTNIELFHGVVALAAFAATYSLYGGLKAVALTDIIQVVLLVLGGLLIAYIALDAVADGHGAIRGFQVLMREAPDKFHMILSSDHPEYTNLPGLGVLVGGLWIMNLSYWGFNQYIIQRALSAVSLREAQKGIVFAGFLKLLMPLIIVVPGIAAGLLIADLGRPDQAYPELMKLAPAGIRGLIFAALLAAIVSSVGSMMNTISTIFTMDLYKSMKPSSSESHLLFVGRVASVVALVIAVFTAKPLLGNFEQAFQYIQEFTGFFTPGVVSIFLLGMFWKQTTSAGALAAAIGSALFSIMYALWLPDVPFMDRVGYVFVLCTLLAIAISAFQGRRLSTSRPDLTNIDFTTDRSFNFAAVVVSAILILFYSYFW